MDFVLLVFWRDYTSVHFIFSMHYAVKHCIIHQGHYSNVLEAKLFSGVSRHSVIKGDTSCPFPVWLHYGEENLI